MTAIRKHLVDFIAIIVLLVLAVGVSSYILTNQRFTLPAWVPLIGKDFYAIEAELSTVAARRERNSVTRSPHRHGLPVPQDLGCRVPWRG